MKNNANVESRRGFLKKIGLGASVAVLASACGRKSGEVADALPVKSAGASEPEADGQMTYRLNNKGEKVSLLGYGCMRWPTMTDENDEEVIDQEQVNRLVDYAIEHGVNYFDTAPVYIKGKSEPATGIALHRHDRSEYQIATKLSNSRGNHTFEEAVTMYRKSFVNLQVDYIDYYLLHNIGSGKDGKNGIELFNERFVDNGVLDFLLKEREAGRIRNLGFSVHCDEKTFDHMMSLHDKYHWDFVQIQMNYVDWHNMEDGDATAEYMYTRLAERNIPVVIMEPLLGGRLSNVPKYLAEQLQAHEPEKSIASWAFRFAGTYPGILTVLSGMTYMEHLEDNLKAYSPLVSLTEDELALLEDIAGKYKDFGLVDCTGCQYCMPCPYGLDIPGIFAYYNKCVNEGSLKKDEGDPEYRKARRAFLQGYNSAVPKLRQAEQCIGCKKCMKNCPQHIRIPKKMRMIEEYAEKLRAEWPDRL